MHGILAIDKPRGITSHDVVARVRRLSGQRRIGHAGTLDPMATGVLLLCLGEATRLSEYLMGGVKWYLARVQFGERTDTDDAEGQVIARSPVTHAPADLLLALSHQVGSLQQIPPSFAAIKQGGVKAYDRARSGQPVELPPRSVEIYVASVLEAQGTVADMVICCSKGTYIRSIARDLGTELGCGAHLAGLRRLASGRIRVSDCTHLAALERMVAEGGLASLRELLLPADLAVDRWPALLLGMDLSARACTGISIPAPASPLSHLARMYDMEGRLLALASRDDSMVGGGWHPDRVFIGKAGA